MLRSLALFPKDCLCIIKIVDVNHPFCQTIYWKDSFVAIILNRLFRKGSFIFYKLGFWCSSLHLQELCSENTDDNAPRNGGIGLQCGNVDMDFLLSVTTAAWCNVGWRLWTLIIIFRCNLFHSRHQHTNEIAHHTCTPSRCELKYLVSQTPRNWIFPLKSI